ncbi:MAG: hypothetical protein CTY12_00740 [Methylotenera sp.]|nr:MAG: hypothetical protein CTY12_00740 [Methylotenera sp.]
MNHLLKTYAQAWLKKHLVLLPEANVEIFHKMYGRDNGKRSLEDALAMSTDQVIEEMPEEKLDWAMQQVERTIEDYSRKRDRLGERGIFVQEAGGQWMFYSEEGDGDGLYYSSIFKAIYEANKFYPLS